MARIFGRAMAGNRSARGGIVAVAALSLLSGCGGSSAESTGGSLQARPTGPEGPSVSGAGIRVVAPPGLVKLEAPAGVLGLAPRGTTLPVPAGVRAVFLTALTFAEPIPASDEACALVLREGVTGADAGQISAPPRPALGPPGMTACDAEGTAPPEAGRMAVYAAAAYQGDRGLLILASVAPTERERFVEDLRLMLPTIELLPPGLEPPPEEADAGARP